MSRYPLIFPKKGIGKAILESLKDQTEGDCGKRMCDGENWDGIDNRQESDDHGEEC